MQHPAPHGLKDGLNEAFYFVATQRTHGIVPNITRNTENGRSSAVPCAVARTHDYGISQRARKRIEQSFGWIKTIGGLRKLPMVDLAAVPGGGLDLCRLQSDPHRLAVRAVADLSDNEKHTSARRKIVSRD